MRRAVDRAGRSGRRRAVAQLNDLGIGTLTGMPSGRTTYRTTDEFNAELTALAATYPTQVVVKDAPYKSIQGRTIKYVEITNNASAVGDGKPVFFNMGGIHGNETPGAEDSLEFAYDVLLQAKTNPKVAALLDKVRLIDLPLTNPDGHAFRNAAGTLPRAARAAVRRGDRPARHVHAHGRRPQPQLSVRLGLEHRRLLRRARHRPGLRARGQEHDGHRAQQPGRDAGDPAHELARDLLPGPGDLRRPDAGPQQRLPRPRAGDGPRHRPTATPTSATRRTTTRPAARRSTGPTTRPAASATRSSSSAAARAARRRSRRTRTARRPTTPAPPGPGSTAAQTARFQGHPVRNAIWLNLVYASLAGAHSQITGNAVPGATLKITKDFNLYTAPVQIGNTVGGGAIDGPSTRRRRSRPTSSPRSRSRPPARSSGTSTRPCVPVPAYEADGVHAGPRGFYAESYTLTCTAADGTLLGTTKVLVDKGDVANITPCTTAASAARSPATLSLTLGRPATFGAFTPGLAKDYPANTTATVISTAGDAALTVADPSATATGHLVNGTFSLPQTLQTRGGVRVPTRRSGGSASPTSLFT